MTTWLIALGFIAVMLLLVILFAASKSGRTYRSYFVWASVFELIVVGLNVVGLVQGLGNEPMQAPGNYVPFIIIMNVFLLPTGLLAALIGWHDSREGAEPNQ